MEGAIAEGQQISCTLTMNEDHPTNPFKHLYHPDHKKGKKNSRNIKLTFNNKPDNNNTDPDDEKYALDGVFFWHRIYRKIYFLFQLSVSILLMRFFFYFLYDIIRFSCVTSFII